jgi:acyl carrier protein
MPVLPLSNLVSIFREALSLPSNVDVVTLEYHTVPQWDSVGHMQLIANIESAMDIMLDTTDVLDMSSFSKAIEILGSYDVSFEP